MKALVVSGPQNIICKDVETLRADGAKTLIKVSYAGICGSDIGAWNRGGSPGACGHEFSGVVVDPGASKDLKAGDHVTAMEINPCGTCEYCKDGLGNLCPSVMKDSPGLSTSGGMADYVLVRPDMVRKLPDNVDDIAGAMTEPTAVAMHAVRSAGVGEGSKVLIIGAGPIGMFSAAVSKAMGAAYIAITEVNEGRIAFANESGYCNHVFQALSPDLLEEIKSATDGLGVDVIIDCSSADITTESFQMLKSNGVYMDVGMHGNLTIGKVPLGMYQYSIKGSFFFLPEDFDLALALMAEGKLDIRNFATKIASFEEVQSCFEELASGKSANVKILFKA